MNNRDVQITEVSLPGEPAENSSVVAESDLEKTTPLPRTVAGARTRLKVIKDKGLQVVAAARRKPMVPPAEVVTEVSSEAVTVEPKQPQVLAQWDSGSVDRLRAQFMHTCLPLFFAEQQPIHSLGITSAVAGEGKTSVAWLVGQALASSSRHPVVLVECDWERPSFSADFDLPASQGLSEYLLGESDRAQIRYPILPNLSVIPAGAGGADVIMALAELERGELYTQLAVGGELMILDLPSVLGSCYGSIAARLAESLMLVVRAGATPAPQVSGACDELSHLRVEGLILNQVRTRVPRWLQHLL
jgi:Mrp family chromosome partitioning ATPase